MVELPGNDRSFGDQDCRGTDRDAVDDERFRLGRSRPTLRRRDHCAGNGQQAGYRTRKKSGGQTSLVLSAGPSERHRGAPGHDESRGTFRGNGKAIGRGGFLKFVFVTKLFDFAW